ncbi:anaerobic ribonucleoside-triphosphate reductase [Aquimarina muelleri]|uniref:Ribonucleoside-triphosphate reductase n=1 Tax=Aquimarina muelleri TaxID=279356 RepID=A0A918JW39_9FLAO|nr:anaerobic ribonucleoside-triphosphate reductase [Aquimarina muelleri]MCX2762277.1 anaerobic ribonucleoside-triphosphate reductase [Aquimarina muelleri]GGX17895.1 ribonucleoside-triphosphate reductase [Aquimarina muelleri]
MIRLTDEQVNKKIHFIDDYIHSNNAADGSKVDANANVTSKNIATMEAELNKDINIQVNRALVKRKIASLFGEDLANEYTRQIEEHEIYVHDETSLKPYCVSISMYPFLFDGLTKLGGESKAPQHLESFCGEFVNLVFAISSQFAGALATVEFLMYFDHFATKDYGVHYLETNKKLIANHLQHVVYAINQPAAARGYQSVFWNISLYDEAYFTSMFNDFVFPNMTRPQWESVKKLQVFFMKWFNEERNKAILTFPVVTAAMLVKNGKPVDTEFTKMCAQELSEGNSFFIYQSENADSLASCCRLRNEISDNTFSYSLGAGGVATGSINVITLNMNRLIQKEANVIEEVRKVHKYQVAYRKLIEEYQTSDLLPVYNAGFISLDKQFLTVGINGMVEAAESQGIEVRNNTKYKNFVNKYLKSIYEENKRGKQIYGYMFNTEFVPAENLGVKNAKWDKEDGLYVPRDCYNSYFYVVEDLQTNTLDKILLHGKEIIQYLDGGSALHLNLEETPNKEGFIKLIHATANAGCNYFCFNIKITICNDCEYINKQTMYICTNCKSKNVDHATRVIGYLKRVSSFSSGRQQEHDLRYYHKKQPKNTLTNKRSKTLKNLQKQDYTNLNSKFEVKK